MIGQYAYVNDSHVADTARCYSNTQLASSRMLDQAETGGDVHIYHDHIEQVKEQLKREPKDMPRLVLSDEIKDLESFRPNMVTLENYNPHERILAKMTVAGGFDEKDRREFKKDTKVKSSSKTKSKPKAKSSKKKSSSKSQKRKVASKRR